MRLPATVEGHPEHATGPGAPLRFRRARTDKLRHITGEDWFRTFDVPPELSSTRRSVRTGGRPFFRQENPRARGRLATSVRPRSTGIRVVARRGLHRAVSHRLRDPPSAPGAGDLVQPAPRVPPHERGRRASGSARRTVVVHSAAPRPAHRSARPRPRTESPVGGTGNSPALTAPAPKAAPSAGTGRPPPPPRPVRPCRRSRGLGARPAVPAPCSRLREPAGSLPGREGERGTNLACARPDELGTARPDVIPAGARGARGRRRHRRHRGRQRRGGHGPLGLPFGRRRGGVLLPGAGHPRAEPGPDRCRGRRPDGPRPGARVLLTGYWNVFLDGTAARAKGTAQDYLHVADAVTREVNGEIRSAAAAHGSVFVDLFTPFRGADGRKDCTPLLAADGDHPDAAGHALIARTLLAAL